MATAVRCSAGYLSVPSLASSSSVAVCCAPFPDLARVNKNSFAAGPLSPCPSSSSTRTTNSVLSSQFRFRECNQTSEKDWKEGRASHARNGFSKRRKLAAATLSRLCRDCELTKIGSVSVSQLRTGHVQSCPDVATSTGILCATEKQEEDLDSRKLEQYRFESRGVLGLTSDVKDNAGALEEVGRRIAKDREWLEEALLRVKNVANLTEGEGLWNCNRGLLIAVPGVSGLNLSGPQSVLEALGVLAAIITVHEAGHFLAARMQNIHVSKFSVGFGPAVAKYHKQGVEYSLRAFPFGGFVAFPDDDPNSEFPPDDPNLLKNRPVLDRALVISAGVIANVIFAYSVLFVQTLGVGLLEREMLPGVVVPDVMSKSAASKAGMHVGDVIMAVDGYKLSAKDSAVFDLVDTIKKSPGRPITLYVQRGDEILGVKVTPDENRDGSGRIGVQLSPNAKSHRVRAENLVDAAVKAGNELGRLTATVAYGLKQIFFNFEKTVDSVSGPVAIVAVGAEVARSDVSGLYQFAAIVNLNLAIVNLLPLPALDGGYLAFVLLEAVRGGKKLPDGVEQGIMSSGVLLLLALGVVLMVRDTLNLGFVQQML